MRNGITILLIIAAALTLLGGAIFTAGIVTMTNESSSFTDTKYQNKTYEATDKINGISITGDVANVKLLPYDKEGYFVECYEEINAYHTVNVKDGVLCIEIKDERRWYDFISLFSKPTRVTVYIPAGEYDSLKVKVSTADVFVEQDFTFKNAEITGSTGSVKFLASTQEALNINVSTGDVTVGDGSKQFTHGNVSVKTSTGRISANKLLCKSVSLSVSSGKTLISDATCDSFTSTGDTGDVSMTDLVVKDSIYIQRSTGDVKFTRCDASDLTVVTDTGDVTGSLLSDKVFICKTDTGRLDVPETTTGGKCKITTDTGDIKITVSQ